MKKIIYTLVGFTLALTVFAQIPNPDFEMWNTSMCPNEGPDSMPQDWQTQCTTSLFFWSGFSSTTDAYSGTYACKMQPSTYGDFAAIPIATIIHTVFTVNFIPQAFSGYYKLSSAMNDSALMLVYFKEYNSNTSRFDTVQTISKVLDTVPQYTAFTLDVPDIGLQNPPDSVIIYIASSYTDEANPYGSSSQTDATLWIDDLDVSGTVGIKPINADALKVFPNPVSDKLYLNGKENFDAYEIIDATGKSLGSQPLKNTEIEVSDLPAGLFSIRLFNENWAQPKQFKFVVE